MKSLPLFLKFKFKRKNEGKNEGRIPSEEFDLFVYIVT